MKYPERFEQAEDLVKNNPDKDISEMFIRLIWCIEQLGHASLNIPVELTRKLPFMPKKEFEFLGKTADLSNHAWHLVLYLGVGIGVVLGILGAML